MGGPGTFLPKPGLLVEPAFNFGHEWDKVLYSKNNDKIKKFLKDRNIDYFIFDLNTEIHSNLLISSLFENNNIPKYFKISMKKNNLILFTWKEDESKV